MKLLVYLSVLATTVVSVVSCRNSSEISDAKKDEMMKSDISEGKVIYLRNCTGCHAQKTVEDYTEAQWANILPRMIIKAELNDEQSRQVKAYVDWELVND